MVSADFSMTTTPINCNGCTACCKRDTIRLRPSDDPEKYHWHTEGSDKVLDRKANHECVYLTPKGCGIHGNAPEVCRQFDCRELFNSTPKVQRRIHIASNSTMHDVYEAGKKRVHQLRIANGD